MFHIFFRYTPEASFRFLEEDRVRSTEKGKNNNLSPFTFNLSPLLWHGICLWSVRQVKIDYSSFINYSLIYY